MLKKQILQPDNVVSIIVIAAAIAVWGGLRYAWWQSTNKQEYKHTNGLRSLAPS